MLRLPNATLFLAIVATLPVASVRSQEPRSATAPVHELTRPGAASTEHFGSIAGVRVLSDGTLLVNDAKWHQLILLDSALRRIAIVLDSASGVGKSYGRGYTPIIPYLADSTLYVDAGATSLVMITPTGAIGRVMAPPTPIGWSSVTFYGAAADARGDLIYRMDARRASTQSEDTAQVRLAFTYPDSFFVVRASFATRTLDTIGRVRSPAVQELNVRFEPIRTVITSFPNVLPTPDDYAVLSDGSIVFVRGHDYHVDVVQPNGQHVTGPKLPFDWKRLTDADKQSLIDSANAVEAHGKAVAAAEAAANGKGKPPATAGSSGGNVLGNPNAVATIGNPHVFESGALSKDQIVDYYPPIRKGALKADMNANLWILPTTSAQSNNGELIYDVVNNHGELAERVRVPAGRSIAGFGKNGEVYLMLRDADGWLLERTAIRR